MTNLLRFLLPFGMAFLNEIVWRHAHSPNQALVQIWTGVIVLFGLAYASGTLPQTALKPANLFRKSEAIRSQHPWVIWVLMSGWSIGWMVAMLTLPSGSFLRLLMLPIFFGLVWCSLKLGEADNLTLRNIMVLTLGACACCLALLLTASPFRLARLLIDWTGPLDLAGRHFQHAEVLKAWSVLQFWGPSRQPMASMHLNTDRLELLRFTAEVGVWPGALMGATLILGWWAVWCWLRRTVPRPAFTIEMRRMGLALVIIHGVATVAYVLFNMGLTRQPFGGGLPPYSTQPTWWVLGVALTWILISAVRANRSEAESATGKSWWISLMGYALVVTMFATVLVVVKESQRGDQYAHFGSRAAYLTRAVIRDANQNVIAENVLAYDLWFIPSDFWAPSLLNPKHGAQEEIGDQSSLKDSERQKRLLNALTQWPQTQRIVKARMDSWPKSKDSLAVLAWAITPEIAKKLKAQAIPGVLMKPRTVRHYPDGHLYAHALGFAGLADIHQGQEGLELAANLQLATKSPDPGAIERQGLNTTLVPGIQKAARYALQAGMQDNQAKGGAIVVIDVQKNEIAAMVSAPDFDPNDFSTYRNPYQPDRILNRATSLNFPIGPLITPLLVAHGIESGRIPDDWEVKVGQGKPVLQFSESELHGIKKTLGLGEPMGIPGLIGGANAAAKVGSDGGTLMIQATQGQSTETNLMQLVKAYLPLATSGYLHIPTMLAGPQREVHGKRVLSNETVITLRQALKQTEFDGSTATGAQLLRASVVGNTVTIPDKKNSRPNASVIVGMFPAEQPKWLVGVLLEYSKDGMQTTNFSAEPVLSQLVLKALLEK